MISGIEIVGRTQRYNPLFRNESVGSGGNRGGLAASLGQRE
jgi:hypothetical protein